MTFSMVAWYGNFPDDLVKKLTRISTKSANKVIGTNNLEKPDTIYNKKAVNVIDFHREYWAMETTLCIMPLNLCDMRCSTEA